MNTWFRSLIRISFLAALILGNPSKSASPVVGASIPNLADMKLEGTLPDMQGKVVLVDFWASWCAPCKKSFPVMKELHEKFSARGFVILAISVDEEKSEYEAFLKKNPVSFATVRDAAGKSAEAFGVDKMPTSFLIGVGGKVAAIHSGFQGEPTRKKYLQEIETALKAAGK